MKSYLKRYFRPADFWASGLASGNFMTITKGKNTKYRKSFGQNKQTVDN